MSQLRAVPLPEATVATSAEPSLPPVRASVTGIDPQGWVMVTHAGLVWRCEVLDVLVLMRPLVAGDAVLVLPPCGAEAAVVMGRIGRQQAADQAPEPLVIQAPGGLSLQSGEGSVELRPNGQVLVRGEDVLIRAKGTQRIRAGTVAIN